MKMNIASVAMRGESSKLIAHTVTQIPDTVKDKEYVLRVTRDSIDDAFAQVEGDEATEVDHVETRFSFLTEVDSVGELELKRLATAAVQSLLPYSDLATPELRALTEYLGRS